MVPSSTRKVQYVLTVAAQAVAVPFFFVSNNHVRIVRTRDSVDTALTGGFTLTGAGVEAGGTCTFNGTQTAIGDRITIRRQIPLTQLFDYVTNDKFPATSHERALDQLTMLVQEQREITDRALVFGETEVDPSMQIPLATRKNRLLGFDNNGAIAFLDQLGVGVITGNVIEVSSYAAARGISPVGLVTGRQVRIAGYAAADDGAGGLFTVTTADPGADNNGTILKLTGVPFWLKRSFSGWINIKWFGAKCDGVTDDYDAWVSAVAVAQGMGAGGIGGGTIYHPGGTSILRTHVPIRLTPEPIGWLTATNYAVGDKVFATATGMYYECLIAHVSGVFATDVAAGKFALYVGLTDYHNMRVTGNGRSSIIKTKNAAGGADVFQLNAIKNLQIDNVGLASDISGGGGVGSGSNGISFTNGCENVTVARVHGYVLPYIDNGAGAIDGGSFLSIQMGGPLHTVAKTWKNIQWIDCTADGGSHGLMCQGSGTGMATGPMRGLLVKGCVVRNFWKGSNIEMSSVNAVTTPAIDGMDVTYIGNKIIDCQQGLTLGGSTGVNFVGNTVYSTLTGVTGFAVHDTAKFAMNVISSHRSNVSSNTCYMAESNFYINLAGGFEAKANTPCVNVNLTGNNCHGVTVGYGIRTSATPGYKWATTCTITGNTLEGNALGIQAELFNPANQNVIVEPSQASFPAQVGTFSDMGVPFNLDTGFDSAVHLTPWYIAAPWSVAAGKAVCTASNSQSIFQYVTLIAARVYEIRCTVSDYVAGSGGLFIYNEATAEFQGVNTAMAANGQHRYIVVPASSGVYRVGVINGAVASTFKVDNLFIGDAPLRNIGYIYTDRLSLGETPIAANNAAAAALGLHFGAVYRTGADPDVLCMRH